MRFKIYRFGKFNELRRTIHRKKFCVANGTEAVVQMIWDAYEEKKNKAEVYLLSFLFPLFVVAIILYQE